MAATVEYGIIPASFEEVPKEIQVKSALWFNITMNDQPIPTPYGISETVDGFLVAIGVQYNFQFTASSLYLPYFGWHELDEANWKAREAKIRPALLKLVERFETMFQPPARVSNLCSNEEIDKTPVKIVPEIAFRPAGTKIVQERRQVSAGIFLTCPAYVPSGDQPVVVGTSDDGALKIGCHATKSATGVFVKFPYLGRLDAPKTVAQFSKDQIHQALANLAANLLDQPKPDGLVALTSKTITTLRPL